MTETTKTVLERYQIRKSKHQKKEFADYVQGVAKDLGYESHREKGSFGAQNIVVGDPEHARVVYTAHYDTCARMFFPNLITPKSIPLYLLYQIAVCVILYLPIVLLNLLIPVAGEALELDPILVQDIRYWVSLALLIGVLWLLMAGPANRHTANDNTSGVTVLLDTMAALPEEERANVAFVFFDLEEMGLFGSSGFAKRHKKEMKNKLLINFDCVSDGNTMLFAVKKGAISYMETMKEAFPSTETHTVNFATKGYIYPSDQANFPCGVGVAALKTSKRGVLYMDRIHTKRDTVFCEENIAYLTEGAVRLARLMAANGGESL